MSLNHRQLGGAALALLLLAVGGCASKKVMAPPRVDLVRYERIGMLELSSNARGNLREFASQKLLEAVQTAQPGARVLELGSQSRALKAVGKRELDFEAVQAIGRKYGVDALIVGRLAVTDVKPKLSVSRNLTRLSARADVEATLTAKLMETASGATAWTHSAHARESVAHVNLASRGPARFGAGDPETAYGRLVYALIGQVTRDFRPRWVKAR